MLMIKKKHQNNKPEASWCYGNRATTLSVSILSKKGHPVQIYAVIRQDFHFQYNLKIRDLSIKIIEC